MVLDRECKRANIVLLGGAVVGLFGWLVLWLCEGSNIYYSSEKGGLALFSLENLITTVFAALVPCASLVLGIVAMKLPKLTGVVGAGIFAVNFLASLIIGVIRYFDNSPSGVVPNIVAVLGLVVLLLPSFCTSLCFLSVMLEPLQRRDIVDKIWFIPGIVIFLTLFLILITTQALTSLVFILFMVCSVAASLAACYWANVFAYPGSLDGVAADVSKKVRA